MKRSFGPYDVEQELARGGMGVVYAVRHRETGARYALKTLPSLGASVDDLARFRREADLMGRLDHPGIVKVHTTGVDGGIAYLVQSFLPGGSLRDRLRERGRLPREEAVALVLELTQAVAHAHAHGVLHRDLKPDNILFDERDRPVLVDFGLGRDLGAESRRLTETGQVMGTPGYMAPEQVQGDRRDDPRTDVYGLGAVLFALLAGEPPFTGKGLGILPRIVHDSAPDLSAVDPETPPALAATVARCLAKRPGDRFASVEELARVLRSGEEPVRSDPSLTPALIAVGGLAVAGLVVFAVASPPAAVPEARETADASPGPTPRVASARPAEPDPKWERASWLVTSDPVGALSLIRRAGGEPRERDRARLLKGARYQARRCNQLSAGRATSLTAEEGARWLACLRIYRRFEPDARFPSDYVQELGGSLSFLTSRTRRRFPRSAQMKFVQELVEVLGAHDVPGVPEAVIRFVFHFEGERKRRAALPMLFRMVERVPAEPKQRWSEVQRLLLLNLHRFGPQRPLRADEPEAKALAGRLAAHVAKVEPLLSDRLEAHVARVSAVTALQLGRLAQAEKDAKRGARAGVGDETCRSVLIVLRYMRGADRRGVFDDAIAYLKKLHRSRSGQAEHLAVLGIAYRLRAFDRVSVRDAIDTLIRRKYDQLHEWGLRRALVRLETQGVEKAREALVSARKCAFDVMRAVEEGRRGRCCPDGVHAALDDAIRRVTKANLEQLIAPFDHADRFKP